jgi:outer membrane protein assembly factor BamB
MKNLIVVGVALIFLFQPITLFADSEKNSPNESISQAISFSDKDLINQYHKFIDRSSIKEKNNLNIQDTIKNTNKIFYNNYLYEDINLKPYYSFSESPWPMWGHDQYHSGRSPYNSSNLTEKWRFKCDMVEMTPVIDSDGIIYFGDFNNFYAMNRNGTMKWMANTGSIYYSPAIAKDGTIYVPSFGGSCVYAFNPDGKQLWKYHLDSNPMCDIAIAEDGTIYESSGWPEFQMIAINPNGTTKWISTPGTWITSTPALGSDGTLYFGSHNGWFYALYPNNGSIKWNYQCGSNWVVAPPSIGTDGTIYIGDWDCHFYAFNPDGTVKWLQTFEYSASHSASIGEDGTIYLAAGPNLYALYPNNGKIKWTYHAVSIISACSPLITKDGRIFLGGNIPQEMGGELIVVNLNGRELWREKISNLHCYSSPVMSNDGTVYIGSTWNNHGNWFGYLHAFGSGTQTKIEVLKPKQGHLYLFNRNFGRTLSKNTVIVGSVDFEIKVYDTSDLVNVSIYLQGLRACLTSPPYTWKLNQEYGQNPMKDNVWITAYFKGGSSWTEMVPVVYYHFL